MPAKRKQWVNPLYVVSETRTSIEVDVHHVPYTVDSRDSALHYALILAATTGKDVRFEWHGFPPSVIKGWSARRKLRAWVRKWLLGIVEGLRKHADQLESEALRPHRRGLWFNPIVNALYHLAWSGRNNWNMQSFWRVLEQLPTAIFSGRPPRRRKKSRRVKK